MQFLRKINYWKFFLFNFFLVLMECALVGFSQSFLKGIFLFSFAILASHILLGLILENLLSLRENKNFTRINRQFFIRREAQERFIASRRRKNKSLSIQNTQNQYLKHLKNWEKIHTTRFSGKKVKLRQILLLVFFKMFLLILGLSFSIQFIGDKLILAVVHYALQIFIFTLSIKRK